MRRGLRIIHNYIKGTAKESIILKREPKRGIDCHVEAEFPTGGTKGKQKTPCPSFQGLETSSPMLAVIFTRGTHKGNTKFSLVELGASLMSSV